MPRTDSPHTQLAIGVALALGFASVGTASAQTPTDTSPPRPLVEALSGAAKRDYAAGQFLYQDGDYEGALLKFTRSYDESGDPRLLWNAAVCEKARRHYVRAIALVRRYLDSHSPLITAEAARVAEAFLAAAEPLTVPLDIAAGKSAV